MKRRVRLAGDPNRVAFAINNSGKIGGRSGNDSHFEGHAVLWWNGSITDLGPIGENESVAYGINDAGQACGVTAWPFNDHAVLWNEKGEIRDLGSLGTLGAHAAGINNLGQIVGSSPVGDGPFPAWSHPFLYSEQKGIQDLGTIERPPGVPGYGVAKGINNRAEIVGLMGCGGGVPFAAIWDATRGWRDLNTLIPGGSEIHLQDATAIND